MSDVTVREVERRRKALPNGAWGMLLLIATEATLFGTLFATYFYLRSNTIDWPPQGVPHPKVALPLVLNGILVLTAVPMFLAARGVRSGRLSSARWLILLALLVQGAFFGIQLHEIASDLDKFSPKDSAYGSIYFTMLGVHEAHVAVGVLLNAWLLGRLVGGLTTYRATATRAIAFYWYFVAAISICTVLIQVSPSL
jgi:heme/copper-type cytochrome/quinol oxidase subunit 3